MTFVRQIITRHRTQLEGAGLLHRPGTVQLPPRLATMRTSPRKAMAALRARPLVSIHASPFQALFEVTLPKIEHVLMDVGEERAEQIVGRLVEHGQAMIRQHKLAGAGEHLEELFGDLPNYEAKLREENGLDTLIGIYSKLYFDGRAEDYLRLKLGDKIEGLEVDEHGMISLTMKKSTTNSDLTYVKKAANIKALNLSNSPPSPAEGVGNEALVHLASLSALQELYLDFTQVSDLSPLAGLSNLRVLKLWRTKVADIAPLTSLSNLQVLDLATTRVADISPLACLSHLQSLYLFDTRVSDAQVEELKAAIPGLEVKR